MNQIKIKAPLKYHLRDYRHVVLIMYLCVYIVILLTFVSYYSKDWFHVSSSSGLELITAVTILVVGMNTFKENFKFFSVNGVSRKTQSCSTVCALGILSAVFAFIDTINFVILTHVPNYSSLFAQSYAQRYNFTLGSALSNSSAPTAQMLLENFLWLIFLYFLLSMIGLFITTLYYRMNKGLKIAVSIAVPTLLINGFGQLDSYVFGGKMAAFIKSFFNAAMGFSNGGNPYIAMFSMFVSAAFFAALSFLLARKASIKK